MSSTDAVVRDRSSDLGVRPYEASEWAGAGVTPFGEEVLHQPTLPLKGIDGVVEDVARYMVEVMHARRGIGLAANQVGLPWRMFVHNLPRVAPQVIINPTIIDVDGTWEYSEACLSMTIEGTRTTMLRPKRLRIDALDLSGAQLRITADEVLARVFQHEIDHLDGLVYVQRLDGEARRRVYEILFLRGVDTKLLPARPYQALADDGAP